MDVAVTGASGVVGRFVVAKLLKEGACVRALARPQTRREGLAGVCWHEGNLTETAAVAEFVRQADAVVHCALQHQPGRYRGGEGNDRFGFWRTNLLAGVELMEHARLAGVQRLVFVSSRAVFGHQSPAQVATEETRPVPDTHYGALKLALEAHASAFAAADRFCCVSLRPTGVYGLTQPIERSKWFDLALAVRRQRPLPAARLATEVHGADVAAAVWLLLTASTEQVAGRSFNCSDLVVDSRDVMQRLAAKIGRPAKLPAPAQNVVRHPMRSDALKELGWQPGGRPLLLRTVDELAAATAVFAGESQPSS